MTKSHSFFVFNIFIKKVHMNSNKNLLKENISYSNLKSEVKNAEDLKKIDPNFLNYINQAAKNNNSTATISAVKDNNKVWLNKFVNNYGQDLEINETNLQPFKTYLKNYKVVIDPTQKIVYVESSSTSSQSQSSTSSSSQSQSNQAPKTDGTQTTDSQKRAKEIVYGSLRPFMAEDPNKKQQNESYLKEDIKRMKNLMNL